MKILILKNRIKVDIADDIQKASDFFKSKGVDMQFEVKNVDIKGYTYHLQRAEIINGVLYSFNVLDGVESLVAPLVEPYKYHGVIFAFDNTEFPGVDIVSESKARIAPGIFLINLATSPLNNDTGWIWKSICHEVMHLAFTRNFLNWKLGDPIIQDCMDSTLNPKDGRVYKYWNNDNPYATEGNFAEAFRKLAPYWDRIEDLKDVNIQPAMKTATLTRIKDTGFQTMGVLSVDGFNCNTLERSWKNNQRNISCIPKGTYICKRVFSTKFMKYVYQLMDVPNRSSILIHSGNYFFDIQGCILLGRSYVDMNSDGQIDILNSRETVKKFEEFMGKQTFKLIIN